MGFADLDETVEGVKTCRIEARCYINSPDQMPRNIFQQDKMDKALDGAQGPVGQKDFLLYEEQRAAALQMNVIMEQMMYLKWLLYYSINNARAAVPLVGIMY